MFDYEKQYKSQSIDRNSDPRRFSLIAEHCKGKVLDIGCCFGVLADFYFGDYTGLDFSSEALEKAKQVRRPDAKFILRDCSDLTDFDFSGYDTIVIGEFLEHFENDEKILDPIFKQATLGTRIIITTPNGPRIPDPSHLREITIPMLRKRFSQHGRVKFYNWDKAARQIFMTCDIGLTNLDLLSLVMIVKDEAKGLEKAILSCLEIVDNITISVDSRSTDETSKIAKLYADDLKFFVFDDDFSKARNEAQQDVKTEWIMFLDGHEYVFDYSNLEKMLKLPQDGLLCSVELENGFIFQNPRIFKNGVKFEGKIHEKQMCKTTVLYPEFKIKHDRVGSQEPSAADFRNKQRDDMVPRLLGDEIKKNKKNTRALFHLALWYQSKGNFKNAISTYRKYLKYSKNKQERWFVFFQRALCFMAENKNFRANWSCFHADNEMPGRWEVSKINALLFFQKKDYSRALEYLVKTFDENRQPSLYKPLPRDDSTSYNLMGECFFFLNDLEKSYLSFDRAAVLSKDKFSKQFFEKRAALVKEIYVNNQSK